MAVQNWNGRKIKMLTVSACNMVFDNRKCQRTTNIAASKTASFSSAGAFLHPVCADAHWSVHILSFECVLPHRPYLQLLYNSY